MRSYGQYCGLARALDVVGNRRSLLVVRELLTGPARYGQLQAGLPGISTNLLTDRLRELEDAGVVRRQLDNDTNGIAYALTAWGQELRNTVASLVNWSTPLMDRGPQNDSFQPHWLVVALQSLLGSNRTKVPATVGVEVDGTTLEVRIDNGGTHVGPSDDEHPTTVLRAEPLVILALATGVRTVQQAIAAGNLDGDPHDLAAVFAPR